MIISNEKLNKRWQESTNTLADNEVLKFATTWANLIEKEMKAGRSFFDVWRTCKAKAKSMHISRLMERKAETYLIQTWQYGPELRIATNADAEKSSMRIYYNKGRTEKRGSR